MSEKTHQPSEQKKRKARQEGQLARSRLFTSSAVTLGGMAGVAVAAPVISLELRGWTAELLASPSTEPSAAVERAAGVLARATALPLALAVVGAVAAGVVTAGLQLNVGLVAPRLDRLDAVEGFKKLFSAQQLLEVGKGLLVAVVMTVVLWGDVEAAAGPAFRLVAHDGPGAMGVLLALLRAAVVKGSVVLVVLGAADLALARRKHTKDLMMSHEEVKQEHKNSEGDPHHKAKRKSLHKQLATGGPARGVQKASAVVVNPTHIAVGIRYDEAECEAPYIVAKAREEDALKMRKEAEQAGIPVVRDVPLARSLVHYEVGEQVPEELYQAAAAVLAVALEQSRATDPSHEEDA